MRLGLFGGSFNPVHAGHLLVARSAREELGLDRIVFVPARESPFKHGHTLAPGLQRLQMLRLALAGCSWGEVDGLELSREGPSYTVETLRCYARQFPGSVLFYVIGADHVRLLAQWRDAAELARLAQFVVLPRPGQPAGAPPAGFRVHVLRGCPVDISASEIRERVRAQLPIDWLVPPAVADAIRNNGLYL